MEVALLIPAWNEEEPLPATLASIPPGLFHRIVVVDNGSTDATAQVVRAAAVQRPEIHLIQEARRGYGQASLAGLAALPASTEAVAWMQADGSEDPREFAPMLAMLANDEADLIIGSRTRGQALPGALLPHQRFGNWLATSLIGLLWGHHYSDLGAFRVVRRSTLDKLAMADTTYGWTIEMQIKALQAGARIAEVPVSYRPRVAGTPKVSGNLRASCKAGQVILSMVWRLWRRPLVVG